MSRAALTTLLSVAVAASIAGPAHAAAPKAGQYIGQTKAGGEVTIEVAKGRVRRFATTVRCGPGTAQLVVRGLRLRRHGGKYRFGLDGRRTLTYLGKAEGARVRLSGHFARTGGRAFGRVRVRSKHCVGGSERWSARRATQRVQVPRSAEFSGKSGQGRNVTLFVSGRSIDVAALAFGCGYNDAHVALNSVPLRQTARGFAFSIKASGNVTYDDGHPDENAPVTLSGRFNPAGTRAKGHFRVASRHCGGTGAIPFSVRVRTSG